MYDSGISTRVQRMHQKSSFINAMKTQPQRILVGGASAAGKSRIARRISRQLDLTCVELDKLYWQAGWRPLPMPEYLALVQAAALGDRWIIDGRHDYVVHDLVAARTELVIWMDPPPHVLTFRALRRTLMRRIRNEALWAGNVEDWRLALSYWIRGSLISFCRNRRLYEDQIRTHFPNATFVRLKTYRDVRDFFTALSSVGRC